MDGITGGYVLFGKTVKTGDYENEKAEVRLDFNDPATLDPASDLAKAKTLELLGKVKKAKVADPAPAAGSNITEENGVIRRKPGRPPAVPTVETVEVKNQDVAAVTAADVAAIAEPPKPTPAADPAAVVDDLLTASESAATVITDADLVAALNRKVAQTKNPLAIKQLIGTYVTPPKSAKEIPQEERAAFLAAVEKL